MSHRIRRWCYLVAVLVIGVCAVAGCTPNTGAPTGGSASPIPIELPHAVPAAQLDAGELNSITLE